MKNAIWGAIAALCLIVPVFAQQGGGVVVLPPITPTHCAKWYALNILQDAGSACGSGSGSVTSVSNSDGSLTLTPNPIVGSGTISINPGHANTWTDVQSFTNGDLSLLGAISGNSLFEAPATGGGIAMLPPGNGILAYTSGVVTSIAGTANQVTASAAVGAVTLSIPSDFRLPGTVNLLTLTQPASGATLTLANNSTLATVGAFAMTLTCGAACTPTFPNGTHSLAPLDSPSFVTPALGVATGTSLALGGCTIGTDTLCAAGASTLSGTLVVTGHTTFEGITSTGATGSGNLVYANAPTLGGGRLVISGNRTTATMGVSGQGLVTSGGTYTDSGSSGVVAALYINLVQAPTIAASSPTTWTNAYSAYFIDPIQGTNATLTSKWAVGADSLRVANNATLAGANTNMPGLASSSAAQTGTVCWTTGTGTLTVDTTTTCLLSLEESKDIQGNIDPMQALAEEMKLKPFWFKYKTSSHQADHAIHAGLGAHQVESVDRRLVGYDPNGKLQGVRYADSITSLNVAAIKGLQMEIVTLKIANYNLARRIAFLERRR